MCSLNVYLFVHITYLLLKHVSEIEDIMSEPEPLSDTDLPPRPIKQKKKKKSSKHSEKDKKQRSTELQTAAQDIAGPSSSQTNDAQTDSKP